MRAAWYDARRRPRRTWLSWTPSESAAETGRPSSSLGRPCVRSNLEFTACSGPATRRAALCNFCSCRSGCGRTGGGGTHLLVQRVTCICIAAAVGPCDNALQLHSMLRQSQSATSLSLIDCICVEGATPRAPTQGDLTCLVDGTCEALHQIVRLEARCHAHICAGGRGWRPRAAPANRQLSV